MKRSTHYEEQYPSGCCSSSTKAALVTLVDWPCRVSPTLHALLQFQAPSPYPGKVCRASKVCKAQKEGPSDAFADVRVVEKTWSVEDGSFAYLWLSMMEGGRERE